MRVSAQDEFHQHRNQRSAEDVAGENREHNGESHGREQILGRPHQKDDGNEHDADRQRGNQRGHGDFA